MSYEDGWAAMRLEMPPRIPRTEYSAPNHWELVKAVTGIDVALDSPAPEKNRASLAFMKAWNYDFFWSTGIARQIFGDKRTSMGHAEYAAGGVDRNDNVFRLYDDPEQALDFDPWEAYGPRDRDSIRLDFEKKYRANAAAHPDGVNMTGIYVTLVSGLIDIFGWEIMLTMAGLDREKFALLVDRYASWIGQYVEALAAADAPVAMIHDDFVLSAGPIFHPDFYRARLFPHYRRFFGMLRDSGKKVMFTSDGDYSLFIDDLARAGVDGFVMEPMTNMRYIAEKYGRTHVFIGNADTRILLRNDRAAIRAEVERCIAIGRDCPGFFLAVGNHIPSNTPVDAALYYNEVYEKLSRR